MSVKKIQRLKQTHVSSKRKHLAKIKPTANKNEKTVNNNAIKNSPKNNKKALVIAHEIKFAKLLAGNDKKVRDKVLKNLKKWLAIRSQSSFAFVEQDFMRLWKGLYYCMWMSDKPLIQEELAESISQLVHCFNNFEAALLYTKCTLTTLASEWFGIDQHRLDKFQMLVRRIIRQTFAMCKKRSWDRQWVNGLGKIIENVLSDSKTTIGFSLHITELYMEELSKVSGGEIPEEIVAELVRPFAIHLAGMNDERQIRHVMKHIFRYLLFQSNVGLDYVEKFEAWRHAGFPKGNIDSMERVEIDETDDDSDKEDAQESDDDQQTNGAEDKPLDPRAGRVDVELPQLPFDAKAIADLVTTYRFHPTSTTKTRRQILRIAKEFNELSKGIMPLGIKQVKLREGTKAETNPKSAALRLLQFETELYSDTIRTKRKKKNARPLERDIDSNSELVEEPKKKALSDNLEKKNNKKRNQDEISAATDNVVKRKKLKVKSKGEKKQGNLKEVEKLEEVENLAKTPKKKEKKILKIKQNGFVETDLVENGVNSYPTHLLPSNDTTSWLTPKKAKVEPLKLKTPEVKTPKTPEAQIIKKVSLTSSSSAKKKVKIVLQRNTSQHTSEYMRQLRQSPAIPFDANRKPPVGVLKPSPIPSPVNPFYKRGFK